MLRVVLTTVREGYLISWTLRGFRDLECRGSTHMGLLVHQFAGLAADGTWNVPATLGDQFRTGRSSFCVNPLVAVVGSSSMYS